MTAARAPFRRRTALITGASGGIGEALALQLAEQGADVVLVARSADRLDAVADRIRTTFGVHAESIATDLSTDDGVDRVITLLQNRRIDILIPNAGVGAHGPFVDASEHRSRVQVDLNCGAVVRLVHAFLPGMIERRVGGVMTVASTAAFQPTPGMAVYGATKAFVLSFTEALWDETRGSGVRILALCPGPTDTGFFDAAGGGDYLDRGRQTAEAVARVGLAAFARRGGPTVISGLANTVTASAHRFVPRALMARLAGQFTAAR
ncbi:SDR family NAD(P)-dependent oxidoreductase [Curtobacterium ammoniigenes]|uniref:SDR family NAD(P)-dependent oxidoreductase n=1 Tax=Curtobacterium ammoniigenes TaxID=395387 RepID=UPI00082B887F|nr:SDR family oxidoreductase [Curtobacterium ammoniigenes]